MNYNYDNDQEMLGRQLTVQSDSSCSVTDSGARILHRDEVILALMEVGLGGKLVNETLLKLGFQLDPFPSQKDNA